MKAKRVRRLGHIYRMPQRKLARKALLRGEEGKNKRDRPKWMEAVREDEVVEQGVDDWKVIASNIVK